MCRCRRQRLVDGCCNGPEHLLTVLEFDLLFGGMNVHINLRRVYVDEDQGLGVPTFHQTLAVTFHDRFRHKAIFDVSAIDINEQAVGPFSGKFRGGGMDGNVKIFPAILTA